MIHFKEISVPAFTQEDSSFDQRVSYRLWKADVWNPKFLFTDEDRQRQYERLIAMTGNTPMTQHENKDGMILVKHLSQNPSECHYDLVYLNILKKLESLGVIWPKNRNAEHNGKRVELVELTSGSAGISFGFATKMLGFEGTLFVPAELTKTRIHPMRSFDLNIVRTPPGYVKAASEKLGLYIENLRNSGYESVRFERAGDRVFVYEKGNHRVCIVNHSENQTTIDAFKRVGEEMGNFLPRGVSPDYLLTIMGNFTSSTGISSILKVRYPRMKLIGLESTENPNWFTQRYPGAFEKKYGHDPAYEPTVIYGTSQRGVPLYFGKPELFDDILLFEPQRAIEYQRSYNQSSHRSAAETIGRSTAAALMMAEQLTKANSGSIVMMVNYDKGDRYDEFFPWHASSMTMSDALKSNRFEISLIQPLHWRQQPPGVPTDIPTSIKQAYGGR